MKSIIRKLTDDNKDWFFTFWHDWEFGGCNWYNFSIIEAKGEWDKIMGGIEIEVALLGLHMRWRWNYTMTEMRQDLVNQVAEIKAGTAKTVPWEDVKKELFPSPLQEIVEETLTEGTVQ